MVGLSQAKSRDAAGAFVTDIFREIEEDLRRENLKKLWSRYGRYLIAAAAAALLAAGGVAAWHDHQNSVRRAESLRYSAAFALAGTGKEADAAKVFGAIANEGGGYALLARFEEAALLVKSGKREAAVTIYDRLARSPAINPTFRGLATLLAAMQQTAPEKTIERLRPLTAKGSPWRPTALELTALAKLKKGDKTGALAIFKDLAQDPTTPAQLKARAEEMTKALAA
jgi:hypothetical protein